MQTNLTRLPKSRLTITIELSPGEMQPYLERAAKSLSASHKIEGFRPGMASLGIVIQRLGAQAVWAEAAELAVPKSLAEAVVAEKLQTVGQPHVHVQKLAPDNPFIFTAEATVLPGLTLKDYKTFRAKRGTATVAPEQVDKALSDLRRMFAKEEAVERPAQKGDKVEIDFDLFVDHVAVENGSSRQHPVLIGSGQFLPGFEDQLVGLSKGQIKEFSLPFPKDYFNRQLAGKTGMFKVTAKDVFQINQPDLNDDFAKRAGPFKTLAELRDKLKDNVLHEAEHEEDLKFERAVMDELVDRTSFGELPDLLLESEVEKMLDELKEGVSRRGGLSFDDYLTGLKKSEADLKKEFAKPAERRVKSALILRHVARAEQVDVLAEEVETEVKSVLSAYRDQPDILRRIDSDDYRQYIRSMLVNRKTVERLKSWADPSAPVHRHENPRAQV